MINTVNLFYTLQHHSLKRIMLAFSCKHISSGPGQARWGKETFQLTTDIQGGERGNELCVGYASPCHLSHLDLPIHHSSITSQSPWLVSKTHSCVGFQHKLAGNTFQMFYCPPGDGENILSKIPFSCGEFFVFPVSPSKWIHPPAPLFNSRFRLNLFLKFSPPLFSWSLLLAHKTPITVWLVTKESKISLLKLFMSLQFLQG